VGEKRENLESRRVRSMEIRVSVQFGSCRTEKRDALVSGSLYSPQRDQESSVPTTHQRRWARSNVTLGTSVARTTENSGLTMPREKTYELPYEPLPRQVRQSNMASQREVTELGLRMTHLKEETSELNERKPAPAVEEGKGVAKNGQLNVRSPDRPVLRENRASASSTPGPRTEFYC